MNVEPKIHAVEKEVLTSLKFSKEDVLEDNVKKRLRNIYLKKAELLGNTYKGKVRMVIKTEDGAYVAVETTIWEANEDYISLKGGISVPTKAISEIEF